MVLQARRPYRMVLRAAPKAQTERRLLAAAERLFMERPYPEVRLEDIAAAASVSAPTVIHRFGSKEGLLAAAATAAQGRIQAHRAQAPAGDVAACIRNVVDHYEQWGDRVMHLLSQEAAVPAIREITTAGRAVHVEWIERAFAQWLPRDRKAARRVRLAQLVALTDVYVWKVLRRDRGLSRVETQAAMLEMVESLLERSR